MRTSLATALCQRVEHLVCDHKAHWPITVEFELEILLSYCSDLGLDVFPTTYRRWLREQGLSKNGRLLVDSMMYIATEESSVNPGLFSDVVGSALIPIFEQFNNLVDLESCSSRLEISAQCAFLRSLISDHHHWLLRPDQYGNAAEIETRLLLNEDLIGESFPGLMDSLGWRYREFLAARRFPAGFCQSCWNAHTSVTNLTPMLCDFWSEYITKICGHELASDPGASLTLVDRLCESGSLPS